MQDNGFSTQQGYMTPPPIPGTPSNDDCNMAMLAHLLALFTGFLGPLIIYLVKKEESPFVRDNARNALNFQISLFIYYMIAGILAIILIGFVLLAALGVLHLVCTIIGAVSARDGKVYSYPMTIPFLK